MAASAVGIDSVFAPTKFVAPSAAVDTVVRPELVTRLDWAIGRFPVTLVSAPAGAGKTTALIQWRQSQSDRSSAWIRARNDDGDPQTMAAAIVSGCFLALGLDPSESRLATVLSSDGVSERQLATTVVRDLERCGRAAVIIDDLHVITDAATLALLDRILDELPATTRVILLSRSDPELSLARRRVRGELTVFRFDDLRLRVAEVAELLELVGATSAEAERLVETTGGWAAAVVLKVRAGPGGGEMLDDPEASLDVRRFLLEEVLDVESDDVRVFLLRCAILDDLTPETVAAVTGRSDAIEVFDGLYRRNLFVSRIGTDHPPTFRFHDLFRDFLLERLDRELPAEIQDLHRRAAAALPPPAAFQHFIAARDFDEAAGVLVDLARARSAAGYYMPQSWHASIPEDVIARHPYLQLVVALATYRSGRLEEALSLLDAAAAHLGDDHEGLVMANINRLEIGFALHNYELATEMREWLAGQSLSLGNQAHLLVGDFWTGYYSTDWHAVEEALPAAIELALKTREVGVASAVAQGYGPDLLFSGLGPDWLMTQADRLAPMVESEPTDMATLNGTRAWYALMRSHVAEAQRLADQSAELSDLCGGVAWFDPHIASIRQALALTRRDHEQVEVLVKQAGDKLATEPLHRQQAGAYAYALARSLAARSRHAAIPDRCRRLLDVAADFGAQWSAVDEAMTVCLTGSLTGDKDRARSALEGVVDYHDRQRLYLMHGFPRLELAGMDLRAGDEHAARNMARPILEALAELDGLGLLLVECGAHDDVLTLFGSDPAIGPGVTRFLELTQVPRPSGLVVPATGETLTPREAEVLSLVASGCSNADIADRLFITERTVKAHMTSILRKTGAANRTEAARTAAALGLG